MFVPNGILLLFIVDDKFVIYFDHWQNLSLSCEFKGFKIYFSYPLLLLRLYRCIWQTTPLAIVFQLLKGWWIVLLLHVNKDCDVIILGRFFLSVSKYTFMLTAKIANEHNWKNYNWTGFENVTENKTVGQRKHVNWIPSIVANFAIPF